jgi:hypothetical protein
VPKVHRDPIDTIIELTLDELFAGDPAEREAQSSK